MVNSVLYRLVPQLDEEEAQLVVSKSMNPKILNDYHDSALAVPYGIEFFFKNC